MSDTAFLLYSSGHARSCLTGPSSEDEVEENESELKHLRLKLRALEAVCQKSVYSHADVELVQCIEHWKSDWEDIRTQMSKRRRTPRKQGRHHECES